jgi:molybdenum cofactor cytidylyltransferase
VAVAAARNLLASLPSVLAVVRPGSEHLAERLTEVGCEVVVCPDADKGMGASLVHALSQMSSARGWIIALADMPYVQPATIGALAAAVEKGAGIAAPVMNGKRGNPVAFSRIHLEELLQLRGDEGARRLLNTHPVTAIAVEDPGILRDVDTPDDLRLPD